MLPIFLQYFKDKIKVFMKYSRMEVFRSGIISVFQVKGNKVPAGSSVALDFRPFGQQPPKCQIHSKNINFLENSLI